MSMQPYPGLRPYEEDERRNFFGREADSKILIDQILANRLTLLFAATGVGKSSLLKASVIPRLKEPLGENLDVVYYNDWVASPLPNLKPVILDTLHEEGDLEKDVVDEDVREGKLPEFLEFCCLFASQPFVIVLDQFEEFFRYRNNYPKEEFQAFIDQLTDVVLNKALPVAVVLSMREDYALELNAFKPKLPMILFENYYRLEKLTREAAKEAILTPVERIGFKYEDVLFEMLLKDLLSRELDRSKGSMVAETIETVEPPYLQIICSQLWERDQNDPQKTIRFATYERAGYAKGLLDNYIEKDVLSKFSFQEKQLSSKAFDHLVSRRGTKMPHTVEDLAQTVGVKPDDLQKVLEKLAKNRILRSQQREDKIWYELYHDMFSHSIDDWNTAWKNKMRVRRSAIGMGLATLAGGVIFMGYDAFVNYTRTHLRMSLSDPYSMVELWQGEKGALDIFRQQKFISQIDIPVKDREPDKRLPEWSVSENAVLNAELIGALPLKDRVIAFSEDGEHKRALNIADDSISDTEVSRSKDVIANVAMIQTERASAFLWDRLAHVSRESLRNAISWGLSAERVAYWLNDENRVLEKLTVSNKQQQIALVKKLGWFAPGQKTLSTLAAQLKDDDSDVRSNVAEALGELGSVEALPALVEQLKDEDPGVRSNVAEALGELGSVEALPALVEQLKDEDPGVRSNVAEALSKLGSAEGLPILFAKLQDSENKDYEEFSNAKQVLRQALGLLGRKALPALVEQLKDEDPNVRLSIVELLSELGNAEVLPALVAQLENEDPGVRSSVVEVLGKLGGTEALPVLFAQLKDEDPGVRSSVVEVLGKLGGTEALPALFAQLKDDDSSVRSSVAGVLGQLGHMESIPVLLAQLKDGDKGVRSSVAMALGELGSAKALPTLLAQLKDDDIGVRLSVVRMLGQLGRVEALPALVAQLKDKDPNVRSSVAEALGQLKSVETLPALVGQLKDENPDVRLSVAEALGQLGSMEGIPILFEQLRYRERIYGEDSYRLFPVESALELTLDQLGRAEELSVLVAQLKDENPDVRASMAWALGKLKDAEALPALVAQLRDEDPDVRFSVAEALGQLGSTEALPALVTQLRDKDPDVRSSVAEALGQLGSTEALPALVTQLRDEDPDVRSSVAEALGQLGGVEALQALVVQLKDDDKGVRSSVAEALGQLGGVEALPALIARLKDEDRSVRDSVAKALGELGGAEALPALVAQLKDDDNGVRLSVAKALGQLGGVEALPALVVQLKDEDPGVRSSMAEALGQLGGVEALPALVAQLKDEGPGVRLGVVEALGQLGSAEALPALVAQLKDEGPDVRLSVVEALGQLGNAEALPALVAQLKDENPDVRLSVVEALGQLGNAEALPALAAQLKDEDPYVRSDVAKALGQLGGVPALVAQLKDEDPDVRSSVAEVLGQLGNAEALPALVSQLKDDDNGVRLSVALALGELGSEEALPVLIARLKDEDPDVRLSVALALGELGGEEALPALVAQLKDEAPYVRPSVAKALGQLGNAKALPALVAQLKDKSPYVRSGVAEALGQLGNAEALPALVAQLKDEDSGVRLSVVEALGELGGVPVLLAQLKDEDPNVRSSVVWELGQLGRVEALPALLAQLKDEDPDVRSSAVWALGQLGSVEALPALVAQLKDEDQGVRSNVMQVLAQLSNLSNSKILPELVALPPIYYLSDSNAIVGTDYSELLAMAENPKSSIPQRLNALNDLVEKCPQKLIPVLFHLLQIDEKVYGRKIWPMLGKLKVVEAKKLLVSRIEDVRQHHFQWRDFRDNEPQINDDLDKEKDREWQDWKQQLTDSKPLYVAYYAHALARIDPAEGIRLLSHEIADIRTGAWYGLASLGDVSLVEKLTDLRLNSKDDPLLRHAAYRAIDLSLTTIQHNNKPEDLEALQKWYPDLKRVEMQKEEVKSKDELSITPRVDWTINLISYNLKAKAERHRRYEAFVAKQKKEANQPVP